MALKLGQKPGEQENRAPAEKISTSEIKNSRATMNRVSVEKQNTRAQ